MSNVKNGGIPKYKLLSDMIRELITSGDYAVGERLPGERVLTKKYGVSPVVVREAMRYLEKEGYVVRKGGSGTYVNELSDAGTPIPILSRLALVLFDLNTRNDYTLRQLQAMEHWLAGRGTLLSTISISTDELIRDEIPEQLGSDPPQGLILDGAVQDFHIKFIERLNIPYLVVGNHKLNSCSAKIGYRCEAVAAESVRYLRQLKNQRVFLLVEPFRLHYTKMLFDGYCSAVASFPGETPFFQTCDDDGYEGMRRMLDLGFDGFSLVTTDKMLKGVLQIYAERGISCEENPIVVIGNPASLSKRERQSIHLASLDPERMAMKAARLFTEMYENWDFNRSMEVDLEIEPPIDI